MNKKLLICLMLIIALSGCGKKEEKEIKEEKKYICNEIKDYITKYESKEISFKEFKSNVSSKYNEICSKDKTEECEYIATKLINSTDIALSDDVSCNIFDDEEMKNNCLQSDDMLNYLEPFVGTSQMTVVGDIKVKCNASINK